MILLMWCQHRHCSLTTYCTDKHQQSFKLSAFAQFHIVRLKNMAGGGATNVIFRLANALGPKSGSISEITGMLMENSSKIISPCAENAIEKSLRRVATHLM